MSDEDWKERYHSLQTNCTALKKKMQAKDELITKLE
jgi:hypothetical protein